MNQWPAAALAEVCAINPRLSSQERPVDDLPVSFVPMGAVDELEGAITNGSTRRYSEVAKGYTSFRENDVLFAKITPCMENGKAAIARNLTNGLGFGSTEFHVLRCGERIFPEYLFHYIRRADFRRHAKANFTGTAGQQRVPPIFMQRVEIPLPPLDEQRRIVDILNRANGIRRLRREAHDKTRQLIPALFVDMFGDRHQWSIQTVGEMLADRAGAIRTGPFGSQLRHAEFVEHGVPVLGIDNIVTNTFRWTEARCVPEHKYQKFKRFRVFPTDVIVTIMGTAGRACVVPDDMPECMSTKHLCVMSFNQRVVDPVYVWGALLYDQAVRSQTRLEARGAIMEGWNMSIVRNLRLSVPPLALQRQFAERVADIQATNAQQESMAEASAQLVAALMARLFDGAPAKPDALAGPA